MKDKQIFNNDNAPKQFARSARRSSLGNLRSFVIEETPKDRPVSARRGSLQMPILASVALDTVQSDQCVTDSGSTDSMEATEEEYGAVPYDDSYLEDTEPSENYEFELQSDNTHIQAPDVVSVMEKSNKLIEEASKKPLACPSSLTLESIEEEPENVSEKSLLERIDEMVSDDETVINEKEDLLSKEADKQGQGEDINSTEDMTTTIVTKPAKPLKQTKWTKFRRSVGKFVSKGSDAKVTKVTKTFNTPSPPTERDLFKPTPVPDSLHTTVSSKRGRSQSLADFRKSSNHQISQADLAHLQQINDKAMKKKKVETRDTTIKPMKAKDIYSKDTLNDLPSHSAARLRNRRVSLDVSYLSKASSGVSKEELLGIRSRPSKRKENLYAMFEEDGHEDSDDDNDDYELDEREYDFNRILEDPQLFKLYVKHSS